MRQILVFGDSITCGYWDPEGGWVQRLRKEIDTKSLASNVNQYIEVYNLGVDGDNSTWLLDRFENEIKQRVSEKEGVLILVEIGSNDCEWISKKKETVTSKEQFEDNIKKLAEIGQKYGEKVVFVGFTPIDQSKVDPIPWNHDRSYRNDLNTEFNDIVKRVCEQNKLPFINLLEKLGENFQAKLVDGVHPNSAGHEQIYQIVRELVFG